MKLVSTLPERVGFLHVVPVFDLLVLLLVFFLVGPSLVNQSGVEVEMPVSRYQVARQADASVITLTKGNPPVIWLGRQQVTAEELVAALAQLRLESLTIPTVYIRSDQEIASRDERAVAESALQAGFKVYLLGRSAVSERK